MSCFTSSGRSDRRRSKFSMERSWPLPGPGVISGLPPLEGGGVVGPVLGGVFGGVVSSAATADSPASENPRVARRLSLVSDFISIHYFLGLLLCRLPWL